MSNYERYSKRMGEGVKGMYEEDEWYIRFLKWIGEQRQNRLEQYGRKTCIITILLLVASVSISVILLVYLWNKETDISVKPMISMQEVLQEDKEISVIRTTKMNQGMSIFSLSYDAISSINSETQAIALFNELADASDSISQKDEVITLPKGAGETVFEKISVYTWKKSGKYILGDNEFSELHVVLFMEDQYIEAYVYSSDRMKVDVGVSMGKCK